MTVYIRENGVTRKCNGFFALGAVEALVKKFPRKYRFVLRDNLHTIVEVFA